MFFGLESLVIQIAGSSKSIRCEVHSWSRFLAWVSSIDFELRNEVRNSLTILTKLRFHCKSHFRQNLHLDVQALWQFRIPVLYRQVLDCSDRADCTTAKAAENAWLSSKIMRIAVIRSIGSALDTSTISEAKSLTPCLGRYLWSEPSSTENTNTCQRTFDSPFQCFLIYFGSIFRSSTWA